MTNDELLVAISNMIDPLRGDMQGMQGDIRGLKQDMEGLKQEVGDLKQDMEGLKQEVGGLKQEMRDLKQEVDGQKQEIRGLKQEVQEIKTRVKKIELTQENEILPRLNTIESCYLSTYYRYRDSVEDYEVMKQDISILKKIAAEHSERLQQIG